MTRKRTLWIPAGIVVLAAAVSLAQAPEEQQKPAPKADNSDKPKMECQCPMMAGMKGVKTFADSPGVLLSQAEELGLSKGQEKRIQEIQEQARQDARDILSIAQQKKVNASPKGRLSMMDLARMRMGKMTGKKKQQGMMCPCCMKKMQSKEKEHEKKHKGEQKQSEKQP